MFSSEDLKSLDPQYFSIISTDAYDVTIMSRNTGHYWYLHNPEYPEKGTVIIFHKHKAWGLNVQTQVESKKTSSD